MVVAFALLTPPAAHLRWRCCSLARVALGLGEAAVLPASYELFSRWVPGMERARAVGRFLSGIPLGQIVGLVATAYLTARLGWPATFYVFGALGLVWAAVFVRGVHNSPAADRGVPGAERALLPAPAAAAARADALARAAALTAGAARSSPRTSATTGRSTFWCPGCPSYFIEHLGLLMQQSGWYSALPWLANFVALLAGGALGDAPSPAARRALNVRRALAAAGLAGATL